MRLRRRPSQPERLELIHPRQRLGAVLMFTSLGLGLLLSGIGFVLLAHSPHWSAGGEAILLASLGLFSTSLSTWMLLRARRHPRFVFDSDVGKLQIEQTNVNGQPQRIALPYGLFRGFQVTKEGPRYRVELLLRDRSTWILHATTKPTVANHLCRELSRAIDLSRPSDRVVALALPTALDVRSATEQPHVEWRGRIDIFETMLFAIALVSLTVAVAAFLALTALPRWIVGISHAVIVAALFGYATAATIRLVSRYRARQRVVVVAENLHILIEHGWFRRQHRSVPLRAVSEVGLEVSLPDRRCAIALRPPNAQSIATPSRRLGEINAPDLGIGELYLLTSLLQNHLRTTRAGQQPAPPKTTSQPQLPRQLH
ncbi:MAG: hypothetical protein KC609_07860 [Myxococcales bacterium]|nr:hypothetical protein [Myxococcales bacterium]